MVWLPVCFHGGVSLPENNQQKLPFISADHSLAARMDVCRLLLGAACLVFATLSVQAEDTNLANEVKLLREQNALLQQQVKQQGDQIKSLSRQFHELQAPQASGDGTGKPAADGRSLLNKVILGGEGGAGYAITGPEGFTPNGKFQLDDARLFLDAPVWDDTYFFGEIVLAYPGQNDNQIELGELYVEMENLSKLWQQDDQLNARLGQMYIPFGEEYLTRNAIDNPLISKSLLDYWGVVPGAELYGRVGKISYVAAVQNGADGGGNGAGGDKSVAGRIGYDPNEHWHFSVSGMRTGNLNTDQLSAMWFAGGFFKSIGSASTTQFRVDAAEADLTARWKSGYVKAFGGLAHYHDNDPTADNARNIYYYSAEVMQDLPKKFYAVTRFSQAYCREGIPMVGFGNFGDYFGSLTDNLWRCSLGVGYRFSDRLVLKMEYSVERGHETGGDQRNQEDFFGTEAAFKF